MLTAAGAPGVLFGPAFQNEIGLERNRAAVVDGHMTRHGDNVAETVGLAHSFVKQGSDDAAVRMSGGPLELRGEADTAEDTLFLIDKELQMETRRIVVATTEAAIQRPVRQGKFVTHAALYSHPDMAVEKTFFLETFGCQMNVHDSEKVIGTLQQQGYSQVDTEEAADLILYNTCSIRDKAEQKVFNRLNDTKKLLKQGKRFGVLGCVAQQEGEAIFERAPYVSLVSGSASYRRLPEMLARLEAGERRIAGLDDRQTDETFETEFTARSNPYRGYITIIEGCDKFCAYCVVPYTRGKERSRTSTSVLAEARRMAENGYTEIQLLGQNVNSYRDPEGKRSFAELLAAVGEIEGIRRVRFTTSHPRDFTRDIVDAIEAVPTLCNHVHLPVQSGSTTTLRRMQREYTREQYLERIGWIKQSRRPISVTTDIIVGFPGETVAEFEETLGLLETVQYDAVFAFKYSPRPNTPALVMIDAISDEEKGKRLQVLLDRQREWQRSNYNKRVGRIVEVAVEGHNAQRGQVNGRTSENITLNFVPRGPILPAPGSYERVEVTQSFPNSLVGRAV